MVKTISIGFVAFRGKRVGVLFVAMALCFGANCGDSKQTATTSESEPGGDDDSTCGDGVVAGLETCDDGNLNDGDGCSALCVVETSPDCASNPSTCPDRCGDGVVAEAAAAACDDGNLDDGDGCNILCEIEAGYECTGAPSVCTIRCGDGIVAGLEECDDAATAALDGCGPTCVVESTWTCGGSPSLCTCLPGLVDTNHDGVCTACESHSGTCMLVGDTCADGLLGWVALGCRPDDATAICCLPQDSCLDVGGYCEQWNTGCVDGYAGTVPMDCPEGRASQCCMPVTSSAPDSVAPAALSTSPIAGASDVALDAPVLVTFSEVMAAPTFSNASFVLSDGATSINAVVIVTGAIAKLTPTVVLDESTLYNVWVDGSVTDLAGNSLGADLSWTFTTGLAPDTEPPAVVSTHPADLEVGVVAGSTVSATFTEPLEPGSVSSTTFTLTAGAGHTPVAGEVTYDSSIATFTPAAPLATDTVYTATAAVGITDVAGNPLAADHVWTFTTVDTIEPTLVSTNPVDGVTGVAADQALIATFSEAVDCTTVTTLSMTVAPKSGGPALTGAIYCTGATAALRPTQVLTSSTVYVLTITDAITDLAGHPLHKTYVTQFTTMPLPHLAFVTSISGTGDFSSWPGAGTKGGLIAADTICQARADAAGLAGIFVAWASDANDDAYCRVVRRSGKVSDNCGQVALPTSAGAWIRTDGVRWAPAFGTVSQVLMWSPLMVDEFGNRVSAPAEVYTGTDVTGVLATGSADGTCANWTSASSDAANSGWHGSVEFTASSWSRRYAGLCSIARRLYCLQTGARVDLPVLPRAGRQAFLTSRSGTGDLSTWADAQGHSGIEAGDAICQARASAAGFANPTRFKAWLSTDTVDATDRIATDGPWYRPDGMKVAANKAELTGGMLQTSLGCDDSGIQHWTSARTGSTPAGRKTAYNCSNWTSAATDVYATYGFSQTVNATWAEDSHYACSAINNALYCFED